MYGMNKVLCYAFFGCLVLGFAACSKQPSPEQNTGVREEAGLNTEQAQGAREIVPDQIVRLQPEVVFQKTKKGEAILVCAYESDVAFRAAKLQGAISFEQFVATLPSLDLKQEIIFYCA